MVHLRYVKTWIAITKRERTKFYSDLLELAAVNAKKKKYIFEFRNVLPFGEFSVPLLVSRSSLRGSIHR